MLQFNRDHHVFHSPELTDSAIMILAKEDMSRLCPTGMSVIPVDYGQRNVAAYTATENSF